MAIPKLRHIPGWERTFLLALQNGLTEQVSAAHAGVGLKIIKRALEKDERFKQRYEETMASRRDRPAIGLF